MRAERVVSTGADLVIRDHTLLAAALDAAGIGVAVIRLPELVYDYVNEAFQAFAPEKDMVGCTNDEVFPEMRFLEARVLTSLKHIGDSWRAENVHNRIRRTHDGPLEDVYGTFAVTRVTSEGGSYLLVIAVETTGSANLAADCARLQQDEARRLELASAMDRVQMAIHSTLDYDEVMQRALEDATKALAAKAGAVFVPADGESEAAYVYGFPRSFLGRRFPAATFPFSRVMEETLEPVAVGADQMGTLMNPTVARLFRVRSLLAIPLVARGKLVGGIGLIYSKPHEFTRPEMDFAAVYGVSVSLALENANLYKRQERVADTLQEALLTLPDSIAGIRFDHAYHSASEAVKVGGDFYDLFELEHDRIGITIGDISGKGLEAAGLTSLVKHAVRVQAMERKRGPAAVMSVVNKVLFEGSGSESFATVFFGVVDCDTGELVYCNAGHTASAVLRQRGGIDALPSNSQIVGGLAEASFVDNRTSLGAGDLMLAYTDGVTEARRGDKFFGEERLMRLLESEPVASPQELVARVVDSVMDFSGGRLTDDIAVLALELTGKC